MCVFFWGEGGGWFFVLHFFGYGLVQSSLVNKTGTNKIQNGLACEEQNVQHKAF